MNLFRAFFYHNSYGYEFEYFFRADNFYAAVDIADSHADELGDWSCLRVLEVRDAS